MLSHSSSRFHSLNHHPRHPNPAIYSCSLSLPFRISHSTLKFGAIDFKMSSTNSTVSCNGNSNSNVDIQTMDLGFNHLDLDRFVDVGNKLADAAGEVIRKYFRKSFDILDKEDLSPVTIADQAAEESMVKILEENFPSHAIFGEESGWRCKENFTDYVWVLDPIDGTKSFITGKPLFGTLIALLHKGRPILGIIDQPVLRERWIGISGRRTTLNGQEISTRSCPQLSKAYLYTTSPHLFSGDAEVAFARVRNKVKVPLYGCDCYAYALLASGYVDLVIESGLKPYDFLSLIPVIEGSGGVITDWRGHQLHWEASSNSDVVLM
ncbi:bifunctional phosphatase IMPL2, chloroplastic [Olea europaea subsp. europaea]|uniref:histidinol-phosphatase n=1 Tax=Olea europaea subsp. europaea TaxID=158383 RepID=A0A8S0TCQ3_OLEEU|nr:bifunctional phosphatase IMPL2, chloroplastic [Olea europaea subsp. europaea]